MGWLGRDGADVRVSAKSVVAISDSCFTAIAPCLEGFALGLQLGCAALNGWQNVELEIAWRAFSGNDQMDQVDNSRQSGCPGDGVLRQAGARQGSVLHIRNRQPEIGQRLARARRPGFFWLLASSFFKGP